MQTLKLFTLLRTLEKEEVSAFRKYLKQRHGGEAIAGQVFDYIRKFYPGFRDDKKLEMTYAYQQIFGSPMSAQADERKKMLNTLSDLHTYLKEFLLAEKIRDDTLESQALWLGILQERELQTEFSRQAARFYTATKAVPQKGSNSYLMEMVACYFQQQHLAVVRPKPDWNALQECLARWDTCAETIRLKMICQIANYSKVSLSSAPDAPNPFQPLALPDTRPDDFLLWLYQNTYQLIVTEQEAYYNQLETTLAELADQLDPDELHGLIGYLHNYAATQIRKGKSAIFSLKAHQLNQLGLKHNFFIQKGILSDRQFANIVQMACTAKDFDWAASFIRDQSRFLADEVREDSIRLAQAIVHYEKNEYEQARQLIGATEFRDIHHVMRSKMMILWIYRHLEEDEDKILSYCDAFKTQLGRYPQTEAVEAVLAFVQIFRILQMERVEQSVLIERIEKAPFLYNKPRLLEEAVRYKGRYVPRKRKK